MAKNVHYEILGKRGASWVIIEVLPERNAAMAKAEKIWNARQYKGVRVLKESYNYQDDSFSTVDIFSRGATVKQSKYDRTGEVSPCLTPDDLYRADGRRSIWDLIGTTLSDWMMTPTELLHSLEHYYKLYNTGQKLQDAVQRSAVAFESEQGSIQERMRKLFKVIDMAVEILKSNADHIPSLEMGRLKPLIGELSDKNNRTFLLTSAVTEYLRPAATLEDKFGRTVVFLTNNRPDWVMQILDQLIAEFFLHKRLLPQLLGEQSERGDFIKLLATLQCDQMALEDKNDSIEVFSDDVLRLNSFLCAGALPLVSHVLGERLLLEVEAAKPVHSGGLIRQLGSLSEIRSLVEKVDLLSGKQDQIIDALAARAGRLINSQSIGDALVEQATAFDKMNYLIDLQKVTIGMSGKRTISNFMMPILTRPEFETTFLGLDLKSPIARMPDIVELQQKVLHADMSEMHRRKIAEKLDSFCQIILNNSQYLKRLHKLDISLQQKAIKLLQMLADHYFTQGDSRDAAENQVRLYMKTDGFTVGLLEGISGEKDQQRALLEFKELLKNACIERVAAG